MPIYKSYADFFIQTYIFHHYNIEIPFTYGTTDVPSLVPEFYKWLKACGFIMSDRT